MAGVVCIFNPHRMHEMETITINDPRRLSVCLFRCFTIQTQTRLNESRSCLQWRLVKTQKQHRRSSLPHRFKAAFAKLLRAADAISSVFWSGRQITIAAFTQCSSGKRKRPSNVSHFQTGTVAVSHGFVICGRPTIVYVASIRVADKGKGSRSA